MKNLIIIAFVITLIVPGCAWLAEQGNKAAPCDKDAAGNCIPGTHKATDTTKDAADAVPYGKAALAVILFGWNFVERFRANKLEKGLKSTILAIEKTGKDPETASAIAALKIELAQAHQMVNVQPLINNILARLKLLPKV